MRKAETYRQVLLRDLELTAAARGFSNWLTAADPTGADSQPAAEAALIMIELAAERGELTTVVRLARAAERVLFLAGRWEAWHHTLSQGWRRPGRRLTEPKRRSSPISRAPWRPARTNSRTHANCSGRSACANRSATPRPPALPATTCACSRRRVPTSPPRPRVFRRVMPALGGMAGTLALVAITTALRGGAPVQPQPAGPHSTSAHATATRLPGQVTEPEPAIEPHHHADRSGDLVYFLGVAVADGGGGTYTVTVTGGGSGNPAVS